MRIVCWNMARAVPPGRGTGDPWKVLHALSPDVALLQECRLPDSESFGGHLHFTSTRRGWGTAVWARWPLTGAGNLPCGHEGDWESYRAALNGYVASAVVMLPDGSSLSATSVHAYPARVLAECLVGFPVAELRLPHQSAVWPGDLVWWALRDATRIGELAIVGGDWNTARRFDEVYGPRGNTEFFARMKNAGWSEIARKFHPQEVQTYFKAGKGPYQLDHLFASTRVAAVTTRFEVVASAEVLAVSDHACLFVDADLGSG